MTRQSSSIKGAVTKSAPAALVVVDMFSDFDDKEVRKLFGRALPVARRIANLRQRFAAAGLPVIHINDNEGRWRSTGQALLARRASSKRGSAIIELLKPQAEEYFVLKPKHSIFFATPLDVLLEHMQVHTLVLTGMTGTQCILFSAMDAHVRDLVIYAPRDCIVSQSAKDSRVSEYILRTSLKAETKSSTKVRLNELARGSSGKR